MSYTISEPKQTRVETLLVPGRLVTILKEILVCVFGYWI